MTPQEASDDHGYCRWCSRMVWLFDERQGYPTEGRDHIEAHAPDCPVTIGAQQERERLRKHRPLVDRDAGLYCSCGGWAESDYAGAEWWSHLADPKPDR